MADFATVAELEAFMGTSGLGSRGTAMLGHASAAIRLYTGQDLEEVAGRQEEYAGEWDQYVITVQQRPITAVTSITVDAVAFTEFYGNYIAGQLWRLDGTTWDEGPILITYDSGYDAASDEMLGAKTICLEVAARALSGPAETYGLEVQELRGVAPAIFLTDEEKRQLDRFALVGVG